MSEGPLIVGLGGSAGEGSVTSQLLHSCLHVAAREGARTLAFDGDHLARFPIFSVSDPQRGPEVDEMVAAVRQADALLVATPGYHGAMSGLVKNALDHLELLRDDTRPYLDSRAVGIIVTASGWQACGTALVSVRSAVHALRGWPTPFAVAMNSAEQQADEPKLTGALEILAGQLLQFTSWQAAARAARAGAAR